MRNEKGKKTEVGAGASAAPSEDGYGWYIVSTKWNKDASIETALFRLARNGYGDEIADVKRITVEEYVEGKDGKMRKVVKNKYPYYVYVKMRPDEELVYRIDHLDGSYGILREGGKLVPLSRKEVTETGLEDDPTPASDVVAGDRVAIVRGTLKGFEGAVKDVNRATKKATIAISLFGLETEAEVNLADIKKV